MQPKGKLYLIPCPVTEWKMSVLPPETIDILHDTSYFYVERARTARHFIKAAGHPQPIKDLVIHEITNDRLEDDAFLKNLNEGRNIGVISEAGCPGVADPGSYAVTWAHKNGIEIVPLIGPSSILLALMASGMNGQNFTFHGYLSSKKPILIPQLRQLENRVKKQNETQIWIEAPYRNGFMITTMTEVLDNGTEVCIARDITSEIENIQRLSIKDWKKINPDEYHKKLCVYVMGRSNK